MTIEVFNEAGVLMRAGVIEPRFSCTRETCSWYNGKSVRARFLAVNWSGGHPVDLDDAIRLARTNGEIIIIKPKAE